MVNRFVEDERKSIVNGEDANVVVKDANVVVKDDNVVEDANVVEDENTEENITKQDTVDTKDKEEIMNIINEKVYININLEIY